MPAFRPQVNAVPCAPRHAAGNGDPFRPAADRDGTAPLSLLPRRPLTLRDVSEASGVSEMTVSRVLRQKGDVSERTRERVQEADRRLGYVPNKIAGALASNRANLGVRSRTHRSSLQASSSACGVGRWP